MKIKKSNLFTIIFFTLFTIYSFRNYIGEFYYTTLNKNQEIELYKINIDKNKKYQDILKLEKFKNKPSFIYFNTRFSYERLEKDAPTLREIYSINNGKNINLIFIANGLDDEPEEKRKWIIKINKLNLKGTHISLPDSYQDFETYLRDTINSDLTTSTYIPNYLLANKKGEITDTIFEGKIDLKKIKKMTE
jgi:hypothetical protein